METVESGLIDKQLCAEIDLVSCLITNADEARKSFAWFSDDMFFDKGLGAIWQAVLAGADPVYAIYQKESGRASELLQRGNSLPFTARLSSFTQIIQDCNALRKIDHHAQEMLRKIVDFDVPGAQAEIENLSGLDIGHSDIPGKTIETIGKEFKERVRKPNLALRTGIHLLDDAIGGLFGGELTIVASRPGIGKTALMLAVSRRIARNSRVACFSLEMDTHQLMARMACPRAGLSWTDVRLGKCSQSQFEALDMATDEVVAEMKRSNLVIIDDMFSVSEIHRASLKLKPDMVCIDLLGKMYWPGPETEEVKWYGRAAEYLRERVAGDLDIPVILLHHINRSPDARQDKRPALSDLRNSGALEGVADVVWLLYREDVYSGRAPGQMEVPFEVAIAKNRQGLDCQKIILGYDLRKQDFE